MADPFHNFPISFGLCVVYRRRRKPCGAAQHNPDLNHGGDTELFEGNGLTNTNRIEKIQEGAYWHHLGMYVHSAEPGKAVLRLPIKQELLQIYQNVHGGVVASLIDSATSTALHTTLAENERSATSNMNVYYLQAANGEYLEAVAEVMKRGRRLAVCKADVFNASGELVAHGTAEFYIRTTTSSPNRAEGDNNK